MKKFIVRYKRFVFGEDEIFDVQKTVFLLITHISLIIGIVGVAVDIILDLGLFLTLITILTIFLLLYFHIKVKNTKLELKYSLSFFFISLIILPVLWIFNGGYNGNNTILIFVYFTVIVTILPSKYRFYAFIIYLVMIISLTTTHFVYPEFVTGYENEKFRYVDLVLGAVLYLILVYIIHNTILINYELDRKKINDQNKELSLLINKLNETNHKLEQSFLQVEELNASKDRFITILSHDLRSPFQGLLAITRTLESDYKLYSDEERQFYISQVNRSLDKLYSFLEQLLLWGKLQRRGVELNLKKVSVYSLVEAAINILIQTSEQKKIILQKDIDPSLEILADKEMITTVFRNMILNAIKFSAIGCTVKIITERTDSEISISIIDSGVGISKNLLDKLFKLDHIISQVGTEGEMGTGMGLILCNDIIKKHNGTISVKSEEGKGSTFTIHLPI